AQAGVRITNDLKRDLYDHLQRQDGGLLARKPPGDLMNRFLSDAALVKNGLVIALPAGLLGLGGVVLASALLLQLEWRLALGCFAGLVVCFAAPRRLERLAAEASYRLREWDGRVADSIQEALSAHATVKAFGLE